MEELANPKNYKKYPIYMRKVVYGACLAPLASILSLYGYSKWKLRKSQLRSVKPQDMYYIRSYHTFFIFVFYLRQFTSMCVVLK